MNKSQIVAKYGRESVLAVVLHGRRQMQKGKFPSMAFLDIKNPQKALAEAERMLREAEGVPPVPETAMKKAVAMAEAVAEPPRMIIVIRYKKHESAANDFGKLHFPAGFEIIIATSPRKYVESSPNPENYVYYDPTKE